MLGSVELDEEHDEDPVVRQLLELRVPHLVVLQENARYDTQHLKHMAHGVRGQLTGQRSSIQGNNMVEKHAWKVTICPLGKGTIPDTIPNIFIEIEKLLYCISGIFYRNLISRFPR